MGRQSPHAENRAVTRGRRGRTRPGCLLAVLVPLLLIAAAMLWYDATSVTIRGEVVGKQETVKLYTNLPLPDDPFTERKLLVNVRYTPPNSPMIIWGVKAPTDRFDRTRVGDELSLRYLTAWPRITIGLADPTASDRLRDARAIFAGRLGTWYLWEMAGFTVLLLCIFVGGWRMLVVTSAFLACSVPLFFADRAPRPVPANAAMAIVGETAQVDKTPRWGTDASVLDGRRLTQPYESVELTYLPGPGRDSVRAVDAVDAGSAGALVTGASVAVRYDSANPREAQLAKGTRTFRSRNRFDLWPETLAPGAFGILGLLLLRKRRTIGPSP